MVDIKIMTQDNAFVSTGTLSRLARRVKYGSLHLADAISPISPSRYTTALQKDVSVYLHGVGRGGLVEARNIARDLGLPERDIVYFLKMAYYIQNFIPPIQMDEKKETLTVTDFPPAMYEAMERRAKESKASNHQ